MICGSEPGGEREDMGNEKPRRNWGQSQANYLAALKGKWIKIAFTDGKVLKGVLTGVDTYELFVKPVRGPEVWIGKGAIKYLHPISSETEEGPE
jgi:sRNA-binding regulator protein Hfq